MSFTQDSAVERAVSLKLSDSSHPEAAESPQPTPAQDRTNSTHSSFAGPQDYSEPRKASAGAVCFKCQLPVSQNPGGSMVHNVGPNWYHHDCFSCSSCGKLMNDTAADEPVMSGPSGEGVVCLDCVAKCAGCQDPITSDSINTSAGHAFHVECFKCDQCDNTIDSLAFIPTSPKTQTCMPCHESKISSPKPKTVTASNASVGSATSSPVEFLERKVAHLSAKLADAEEAMEKLVSQNALQFQEYQDMSNQLAEEKALRLEQAIGFKQEIQALEQKLCQSKLEESADSQALGRSIEGLNASVDKLEREKIGLLKQVEDLMDKQNGVQKDSDEVDADQIRETFRMEMQNLVAEKASIKDDITRLIEMKISLLRELDNLRDSKNASVMPTIHHMVTSKKDTASKNIIQLGSSQPPNNTNSTSVKFDTREEEGTTPSAVDSKKTNTNFFSKKLQKKDKKAAISTDELAMSNNLADTKKLKKSDVDIMTTNTGGVGGGGVKKKHNFLAHAYVRKIKCDHCHDKLWGKELRCEDCSFHAHAKCMDKITLSCGGSSNDADLPQLVFGAPLLKVLEMEDAYVPSIVTKCIDEVEARGMDFEGIYRKSGPLTQINKIIQIVNRGESLDLSISPDLGNSGSNSFSTATAINSAAGGDNSNGQEWDIMAVTSVLKQYFRDLPVPLLTFDLYQEFMDASRLQSEEEKPASYAALLARLPPGHYTTLKFLIKHLHRVTQFSAENFMTPGNIGVVFGPTLMRPEVVIPAQDIAESGVKSHCIEFIVRNYDILFVGGDDVSQLRRKKSTMTVGTDGSIDIPEDLA